MKPGGMIAALMLAGSLSWAGDHPVRATLVFVDFYDEAVTVLIDNHVFRQGTMTVSPENQTLGLSLVREADLPVCSFIEVRAKQFTDRKRVCLTDRERTILISAKTEPHIAVVEKVELD